jgi:hypothetical protein
MLRKSGVCYTASMYDQFLTFVQAFSASHTATPIDGEYYDKPGVMVYTQVLQKLPDRGRIEVNTLTPDAPSTFEWQYELTINQPLNEIYIHLLLRADKSLVETYGKTVNEVDDDRAQEILNILSELTSN